MTYIPQSVQMLMFSKTPEGNMFRRTLLALILRNLNDDGEPEVILTQDDLRQADHYTLRCTTIEENDAVVLIVIPRGALAIKP